jgi:hypothetical protein
MLDLEILVVGIYCQSIRRIRLELDRISAALFCFFYQCYGPVKILTMIG